MRAVDREAAWQKKVARLGEFIESIGELGDQGAPGNARMTGFTVRFSTEMRPGALVVLKAQDGDERFVAFVGGLDLAQALLSWRAKVLAGAVEWREDVPYGQR